MHRQLTRVVSLFSPGAIAWSIVKVKQQQAWEAANPETAAKRKKALEKKAKKDAKKRR